MDNPIKELEKQANFRSGHISEGNVLVQWWVNRCSRLIELSLPLDEYKSYEGILDDIIMVTDNYPCSQREPYETDFGLKAKWV